MTVWSHGGMPNRRARGIPACCVLAIGITGLLADATGAAPNIVLLVADDK